MKTIRERFDSNWMPEPFSGCWLWIGTLCLGYGVIDKKKAHRLSWEFHRGEIPKGMFICHKCDTRACVNPDHLFVGTLQDNKRDEVTKMRHSFGERNRHARLTENQVRQIRNSKKLYRLIALDFGISESHVKYIKVRRRWKHVL